MAKAVFAFFTYAVLLMLPLCLRETVAAQQHTSAVSAQNAPQQHGGGKPTSGPADPETLGVPPPRPKPGISRSTKSGSHEAYEKRAHGTKMAAKKSKRTDKDDEVRMKEKIAAAKANHPS
jgi:hypothetical protein